uniref:Uncharacterized protein n=1 Tax=Zosterops lateralis melanops TaxID=1220523 RepID=A0A8D2NR03_ZOSLA
LPMESSEFPVQGSLQHQLRELPTIGAGLHVEVEVVIGTQVIGLQGVGAHVGVLGWLDGEAGTQRRQLVDAQGNLIAGELRGVVVDVQDLHLNTVKLHRVLDGKFQVEEAAWVLPAELLPVYPFADHNNTGVHIHGEVLGIRIRQYLQISCRQFSHIGTQVLGDIAHKGTPCELLRDAVSDLSR